MNIIVGDYGSSAGVGIFVVLVFCFGDGGGDCRDGWTCMSFSG